MINASQKFKISDFSANGPLAETISCTGLSRKPALILQHEWTRFHNASCRKAPTNGKRDMAAVPLQVKTKLKDRFPVCTNKNTSKERRSERGKKKKKKQEACSSFSSSGPLRSSAICNIIRKRTWKKAGTVMSPLGSNCPTKARDRYGPTSCGFAVH